MRKSDFIDVCGVPHLIITYGGWVTDCSASEIVLVIPGNPGLIEYYDTFLAKLYQDLGEKTPVWGISHGGHSLPDALDAVPDIKNNESLYNLEGQTAAKLDFIAQHVPATTRLHLVGHSIGSQICLQLQRRLGAGRVASSYHLFPTVQRMRVSPAGRRLWWLSRVTWLILLLATLLALLPRAVRRFVVSLWLPNAAPTAAFDASVSLLRPRSLAAAITMGHNELVLVDELDVDTVRAAAASARFLFGQADPWVPLEYVEGLRRAVPGVDAVVCEEDYPHAFVLRCDAVVGCSRKVAAWVAKFSELAGRGEGTAKTAPAYQNGNANHAPGLVKA